MPAVADFTQIRRVINHGSLLEPFRIDGVLLVLVTRLAVATPAPVFVLFMPPLEQRDEIPQAEHLPAAVMDFKRDFDIPFHVVS